ncbi:hypothetical protein H0H93_001993 [Arthromyces matolae]|nr:hypothetical protein H0H93_001993 [Arthromyces matolae]
MERLDYDTMGVSFDYGLGLKLATQEKYYILPLETESALRRTGVRLSQYSARENNAEAGPATQNSGDGKEEFCPVFIRSGVMENFDNIEKQELRLLRTHINTQLNAYGIHKQFSLHPAASFDGKNLAPAVAIVFDPNTDIPNHVIQKFFQDPYGTTTGSIYVYVGNHLRATSPSVPPCDNQSSSDSEWDRLRQPVSHPFIVTTDYEGGDFVTFGTVKFEMVSNVDGYQLVLRVDGLGWNKSQAEATKHLGIVGLDITFGVIPPSNSGTLLLAYTAKPGGTVKLVHSTSKSRGIHAGVEISATPHINADFTLGGGSSSGEEEETYTPIKHWRCGISPHIFGNTRDKGTPDGQGITFKYRPKDKPELPLLTNIPPFHTPNVYVDLGKKKIFPAPMIICIISTRLQHDSESHGKATDISHIISLKNTAYLDTTDTELPSSESLILHRKHWMVFSQSAELSSSEMRPTSAFDTTGFSPSFARESLGDWSRVSPLVGLVNCLTLWGQES